MSTLSKLLEGNKSSRLNSDVGCKEGSRTETILNELREKGRLTEPTLKSLRGLMLWIRSSRQALPSEHLIWLMALLLSTHVQHANST